MPNGKPPFRADHVGSLLRPMELREARAARAAGTLDAEALRAIEDRSIEQAIAEQKAAEAAAAQRPGAGPRTGAPAADRPRRRGGSAGTTPTSTDASRAADQAPAATDAAPATAGTEA